MNQQTKPTTTNPEGSSPTLWGTIVDKNAWALLWSQRQNAIHVQRVEDMLSANRKAYGEDRASDYIPLFIGTQALCSTLANDIRGTMTKREEKRAEARA